MSEHVQQKGNWQTVPLGSVVEFLDRFRRPVTAADREPGPYPYYGANGQQDSVSDYIFDEPLVLLAEDGGYFDNPDRPIAYRVDGKCWVNNHAHVLRPMPCMDIGFLCYQLAQYNAMPYVSGSTRLKLNQKQASKMPIVKPPLSEQKRIAAILDAASTLRRRRRAAIKELSKLIPAVFHDMFGDVYGTGNKWPVKTLSDIVVFLDHLRKPVTASDRKPGPYPYYGANGQQASVDDYIFNEPLVLLAEDGGHFEDATRPIAYQVSGKCWVNNHAHVLRPTEAIRIDYLAHTLAWINAMPYVSGSTRLKLTKGQAKMIPIAVPPVSLQEEFGKVSRQIRNALSYQDTSEREMSIMCDSLLQRAFCEKL